VAAERRENAHSPLFKRQGMPIMLAERSRAMKPSDMLHKMCHLVLAGTDVKAICKARGLPPEAAKSRGILETLFLSSQGLADAFESLDSKEIALLHLLKNANAPVDVSFFSRVYGGKHSYGTFNQRFQSCFAKVKQRLIRNGVLLSAEAPQNAWEKKSKMERWRFALPVEFHEHLPPLLPSPRQFDGDGNWQPNVVRDRLIAGLSRSQKGADKEDFQIDGGELQLNGKRFEAAKLTGWQLSGWKQSIRRGKKSGAKDAYSQSPAEAALCILAELADGHWADAEQLAEPLRVFCGKKVDVDSVCQAGWEWGLLAKRQTEGKNWYRPAPHSAHVAPHHYLTAHADGCVTADLTTIPFEALEQIVAISDQRLSPAGNALLLTPNFVKLGRAHDRTLEAESVQWLVEQTQPFAETFVTLTERRGKTILHENLLIARVSDLSLKVAIEKALGNNLVSLKNDFVAFPYDSLKDVERVVKKSGHVVKEVAAK